MWLLALLTLRLETFKEQLIPNYGYINGPTPNSRGMLKQDRVAECSGHLLLLGFPAPIHPPALRVLYCDSGKWEGSRKTTFFLPRVVIERSWPTILYSTVVHLEQNDSRAVKIKIGRGFISAASL